VTVKFRIESVRLDTSDGPVSYVFPSDLTVLAGPTAVGKTTLLELIKYGLGGDGRLAPVARRHVLDVHVSIHIGRLRLQLSRGVDSERQRTIRVADLVTGDRMRDHSVGGAESPISDLLMTALGLETGLRAAARGGRSTSAGAEITFNDVFHFMYVPQGEINRDIAWSQQGYYDPKRKAVFELLFGLTSSSMLSLRSDINRLKSEIDVASRDAAVVQQFLADTGLTHRFDAEVKLATARHEEAEARSSLKALQGDLVDVVDKESQTLRELLNDAERSLADAQQLGLELARQRADYDAERRRVALDIDRLSRMASAGLRLANIEFAVCPRCTQRLDQRSVPSGRCAVCLQRDIVAGLPAADQYESEQLRGQLAEIDQQVLILRDQAARTAEVAQSRADLVAALTAQIDQRTASRITPRLQAYADAASKTERAVAEQESLEQVLRQWDRAEDLAAAADSLTTRRTRLQADLRGQESAMAHRKAELFNELDKEFQTTVTDFGIPSIETASISPDTYLPILNDQPFTEASAAGGIITATQVAYWVSLVTVAGRMRDTFVPAFLLLDSPRLALNAEQDIAGQMYRRFATQVDVTPGRFQFIIADNELPAVAHAIREMTFSYDNPTVSTVKHPGPAHVRTLDNEQASPANDG
jgi:hypothetical protein